MTEEGPLIVDGEKIIIQAGLQKRIIDYFHASTYSSFRRIKETIQTCMVWVGWKETIQEVVDRCEACKTLQPSKPEGAARLDKIPLTSLSPMQIIHANLFKYFGKDYMSICDQVSTY